MLVVKLGDSLLDVSAWGDSIKIEVTTSERAERLLRDCETAFRVLGAWNDLIATDD